MQSAQAPVKRATDKTKDKEMQMTKKTETSPMDLYFSDLATCREIAREVFGKGHMTLAQRILGVAPVAEGEPFLAPGVRALFVADLRSVNTALKNVASDVTPEAVVDCFEILFATTEDEDEADADAEVSAFETCTEIAKEVFGDEGAAMRLLAVAPLTEDGEDVDADLREEFVADLRSVWAKCSEVFGAEASPAAAIDAFDVLFVPESDEDEA